MFGSYSYKIQKRIDEILPVLLQEEKQAFVFIVPRYEVEMPTTPFRA